METHMERTNFSGEKWLIPSEVIIRELSYNHTIPEIVHEIIPIE